MEIRLHPEDIKELAKALYEIAKPEQKEDDIIFLKDIATELRCSYVALNNRRRQRHIPKVQGIKEVAILRKYLPELKKAS